MIFTVPAVEEQPWPTLGPQVCAFIEAFLVFGPGDLRGQPARLDAEKRALLYRAYEVFPQGHPQAGRRRFRRVAWSLRKGSAKTELLAWVAAVELHPDGPVRCDGWDAQGQPVGVGVRDPYIPLIAYTEEQSDDLAYAALRVALGEGQLANDFDIGLLRIVRRDGTGKAVSLASAPDARDGARTTFQGADETHRMTLPRQKQAWRTMLANLPKRRLADAWALETTTAFTPGEGSIAEDTMDYARQVGDGKRDDTRLFFFHRQAGDHDLTTRAGLRAAVLEASGPVAEWSDIDGIVEQWDDPTADTGYLERVWLNRPVRTADKAFDVAAWQTLADRGHLVPDGADIVLGFDGSRADDATALVGTEVATGYQWVQGVWERDPLEPNWTVPALEVREAVAEAFRRWKVWRIYCDPPYWETQIAEWAGEYGSERVVEWATWRRHVMARALQGYVAAIANGELTHSGDARMARHLGNAVRRPLQEKDEQGRNLYLATKERSDSPNKIDLAYAGCLSWEARTDAMAKGVGLAANIYESRGIRSL